MGLRIKGMYFSVMGYQEEKGSLEIMLYKGYIYSFFTQVMQLVYQVIIYNHMFSLIIHLYFTYSRDTYTSVELEVSACILIYYT